MKIVALIDVHPLTEPHKRGLSMRISSGGSLFDLPISQAQAALLLSKITPPEQVPAPEPPSEEEMNLFAQFAKEGGLTEEGYEDEGEYEDDDL